MCTRCHCRRFDSVVVARCKCSGSTQRNAFRDLGNAEIYRSPYGNLRDPSGLFPENQ